MTQPVEFTTADLCSGRWPAPRDMRERELAELVAEFTGQPVREALPKRTPGQFAKDPVWD